MNCSNHNKKCLVIYRFSTNSCEKYFCVQPRTLVASFSSIVRRKSLTELVTRTIRFFKKRWINSRVFVLQNASMLTYDHLASKIQILICGFITNEQNDTRTFEQEAGNKVFWQFLEFGILLQSQRAITTVLWVVDLSQNGYFLRNSGFKRIVVFQSSSWNFLEHLPFSKNSKQIGKRLQLKYLK